MFDFIPSLQIVADMNSPFLELDQTGLEIESQMKLEAQRFLQAILFHCFLELLPELIFWKYRFEAKFGPAAKHEMLKLNFLWYCHLLQIHRSRKLHFCINCSGFPSSRKIWRKLYSWFLLCINSRCIYYIPYSVKFFSIQSWKYEKSIDVKHLKVTWVSDFDMKY